MKPPSKKIRVAAFIDEQDYLDIRRYLITLRISFSAWVREQIASELSHNQEGQTVCHQHNSPRD